MIQRSPIFSGRLKNLLKYSIFDCKYAAMAVLRLVTYHKYIHGKGHVLFWEELLYHIADSTVEKVMYSW